MARAWGGLAPADDGATKDGNATFAEAQHDPSSGPGAQVPDFTSPPPLPAPDPADRQAIALEELREICEQIHHMALEPAQLGLFTFDNSGSPPRLSHRDEHGPGARSYGIVNPTTVHVFVNFGGNTADSTDFPVPPSSALIMPISVERAGLAMMATELGANSATIYRLRFTTVQPFFLGKI